MNYAHGIKHFELKNHLSPHIDIDQNIIRFIKRQRKLESFTMYFSLVIGNRETFNDHKFFDILNQIVDAILVRKTVKLLNLDAGVDT